MFQKTYPYVLTKDPDVSGDGATFSADLMSLGDQKILKYGFVWSENEKPVKTDDSKLFTGDVKKGIYKIRLSGGLTRGKTYTVRAYVATAQLEVYGNSKTFVSEGSLPPEISGFTPDFGPVGTHVRIDGKNFAYSKTGNNLKFGNTAVLVDSVTDNSLFITIPEITKPEKVLISVETAGMNAISAGYFDLWFPWKRMKDFTEGDNGMTGFSIQDKGYILGYPTTGFWEYDPKNDVFVRKSDFPHSINAYPRSFSINNHGYVILSNGRNNYPGTSTITEVWEYDPATDSWTRKTDFPGMSREGAVAFSIGSKGYFGTGLAFDNGGYEQYAKDFWEFDPVANSWTQKADFLGSERAGAFGFSAGTYGYVGFGSTGWPQGTLYRYDQLTDNWAFISACPGNGFRVNGFAINNKCYLGLGSDNSGDAFSDFWEFDTSDNSWKQMRSCPVKMDASVAFSINNKGYIGIGLKDYMDQVDYRKALFEFDPAKN